MKKAFLLITFVSLSILTTVAYGQNNCKVLLPRISDSYNGSCKNGLAEGSGEASGTDHYTGEFKKGLPDGKGTYIWSTGEIYKGEWKKGLRDGIGEYTFKHMGVDSVIKGDWKADKYIKSGPKVPYVVGYRNNVGRVSFWKIAENPFYVKYKFSRAGEASSFIAITNLMLNGNNGTENINTSFTGFENITFPFEGKVRFNAPSALNTSTLDCELRLTIYEPGAWQVTIYY